MVYTHPGDSQSQFLRSRGRRPIRQRAARRRDGADRHLDAVSPAISRTPHPPAFSPRFRLPVADSTALARAASGSPHHGFEESPRQMTLRKEQPVIASVFHQPAARLHQPLLHAGQRPTVDPPRQGQLPQVPQFVGNHAQPQGHLVRPEPMATEPRHLNLWAAQNFGDPQGNHRAFPNEVCVDFDTLGEGLIALVGENGAGKSTLIGSVFAALFRQLRGQKRSLYDFATHPQPEIDLTFSVNGTRYGSLLKIDSKSRQMESYLFNGDGCPRVERTGTRGQRQDCFRRRLRRFVRARTLPPPCPPAFVPARLQKVRRSFLGTFPPKSCKKRPG